MKRILSLFFFLGALASLSQAQTASDKAAFDAASWGWQDLGKTAQVGYAQLNIFNSTQSISVLRYKKGHLRLEVINDPSSWADSTSAMAERHGALAAVNGSFFDMRRLVPVTYVKEDRRQESRTGNVMPCVDGELVTKGKGKVEVFKCDTLNEVSLSRGFADALASGPVLLIDGVPARESWPEGEGFYSFRHPRTIAGTTADGWVYLIVIDGRSRGNADGASMPECIQICQFFGLSDAINLDGGGSSTLWTKKTGVVSHPCDNRHFDHFGQRTVPNIVIVR